MTRKDFKLIADILVSLVAEDVNSFEGLVKQNITTKEVIHHFAHSLNKSFPNFNICKFHQYIHDSILSKDFRYNKKEIK